MVFYALNAQLNGQEALDPAKAFTSVAIISLVTTPANNLLAFFPQFGESLGVARRIQGYLLEPDREDKRILIESPLVGRVANGNTRDSEHDGDHAANDTTLSVALDGVSLRPAATASLCLTDITINMVRGSLNVICGAVGTGKTTLARAVLGDVPAENGSISVSSRRIGYCAQKPWLTNASIRSIITGPISETNLDKEWYNTVIDSCGLVEDIEHFSNRDTAAIGSRGVTLSGGQRQRVVSVHFVEESSCVLLTHLY